MLLDSFALSWRIEDHSPAVLAEYLRYLRQFEAEVGDLTTASLSDCKRFIADTRDRTSAATARMAWRALRAFYKWAVAEGEMEANPALSIKGPKEMERPTTVATEEDVRKLLVYLSQPCRSNTFEAKRDRALIQLLWSTGMRRSEIARMTVDDVDFETFQIVVERSKNGTVRVVPFDKYAARCLDRYLRARSEHKLAHRKELWLGRYTVLTANGIGQAVERVAKAKGLPVRCHSFRRGLAMRWLRSGGSETSLRAVVGWQSPAMVARYVRSVQSELATEEYRRVIG